MMKTHVANMMIIIMSAIVIVLMSSPAEVCALGHGGTQTTIVSGRVYCATPPTLRITEEDWAETDVIVLEKDRGHFGALHSVPVVLMEEGVFYDDVLSSTETISDGTFRINGTKTQLITKIEPFLVVKIRAMKCRAILKQPRFNHPDYQGCTFVKRIVLPQTMGPQTVHDNVFVTFGSEDEYHSVEC